VGALALPLSLGRLQHWAMPLAAAASAAGSGSASGDALGQLQQLCSEGGEGAPASAALLGVSFASAHSLLLRRSGSSHAAAPPAFGLLQRFLPQRLHLALPPLPPTLLLFGALPRLPPPLLRAVNALYWRTVIEVRLGLHVPTLSAASRAAAAAAAAAAAQAAQAAQSVQSPSYLLKGAALSSASAEDGGAALSAPWSRGSLSSTASSAAAADPSVVYARGSSSSSSSSSSSAAAAALTVGLSKAAQVWAARNRYRLGGEGGEGGGGGAGAVASPASPAAAAVPIRSPSAAPAQAQAQQPQAPQQAPGSHLRGAGMAVLLAGGGAAAWGAGPRAMLAQAQARAQAPTQGAPPRGLMLAGGRARLGPPPGAPRGG
jgi:hypothetical protein